MYLLNAPLSVTLAKFDVGVDDEEVRRVAERLGLVPARQVAVEVAAAPLGFGFGPASRPAIVEFAQVVG